MSTFSSVTYTNFTPESGKTIRCHFNNDNSDKSTIADILNLSSFSGLEITDTYKNLRLVHYTEAADMTLLGHIRGILVDVENRCIVAGSYGRTPYAITHKLTPAASLLQIYDSEGVQHSYDTNNIRIVRYHEGAILRFLWYDGELVFLTHKKINPYKSRWVTSPTFHSLYLGANGPSAEQMFDTTKKYSNTCYFFLVCDKSLLVATRQMVNSTYLVHLSSSALNLPFEDIAPGIEDFTSDSSISHQVDSSFIHKPSPLTIEEANVHLNTGYYSDTALSDFRQRAGESVVIYSLVNGVPTDSLQVRSPEFHWRCLLREESPNRLHRFFGLLDSAYSDDLEAFKAKYVIYPNYTKDQLGDMCVLALQAEPNTDIRKKDARIRQVWLNYMLSLPIPHQKEALTYYDTYINDREALVNWIVGSPRENLNPRALNILTVAKKSADASARQATGPFNYKNILKDYVRNLLCKERGTSLYSLAKYMKAPKTQ